LAWVPPLTAGGIWNFPGMVVGSVPGAWLLLGLALLGIWQPLRHVGEVTALALGPIVVVAAVSVLVAPYWVVRYLLIVLTPLALLAAVGLVRPRNPSTSGAGPGVDTASARELRSVALPVLTTLVVLVAAVYPGQQAVRGATAKNGSDYRTAGQLVRRYQQAGDGIVYSAQSRTMRTGLQYYLRDDPGRPRDLLLARSAAGTGTLRAQEYPDLVNHVRGTARVWIFAYGRHDDPTTVRPALRPLLRGAYRQTRIWHLHRATLALFVARTAPPSGHK
jgi:mannosyltransferase